jgi:hypothetical protein
MGGVTFGWREFWLLVVDCLVTVLGSEFRHIYT